MTTSGELLFSVNVSALVALQVVRLAVGLIRMVLLILYSRSALCCLRTMLCKRSSADAHFVEESLRVTLHAIAFFKPIPLFFSSQPMHWLVMATIF
ncbi:MAG: hypothetical protein AB1589_30635 [Cyanobacteriota bacterium]